MADFKRRKSIGGSVKGVNPDGTIKDINEFYRAGTMLGKGSFGEVHRAKKVGLDQEFALKSIEKKSVEHATMKTLLNGELNSLTKLNHAHIVDTIEILEDKDKYYIASEICEGG